MPLLALDVRLSDRLRALGDRSRPLRAAAIPLARSADGWIWVLGALAVAAAGGAPMRRQALWIAAVVVATGIVVKVGKTLARRTRPPGRWGGSYRRSDPHAFPSGHSARAFLLAVLAFAFGPTWLGAGLTLWATLVAVSRVVLGVHYLFDVVGGAVLGAACGLLALAL
ncbi:MAG: phosphatase PAP2 family protein [Deltaproteobacteria bacterium]|nr:phosphatase PAP2 family protein [Deltaproteobacteria bacterium]